MINIPNKTDILNNFSFCENWETKYLYIIELGNYLLPFPTNLKNSKYLITGCQNNVWIFVTLISQKNNNSIKKNYSEIIFYGDSNSSIIKGLISLIFILYNSIKTPQEMLNFNIFAILNTLKISQHLTMSRSNGIFHIIQNIKSQLQNLCYN